MRQLFAVENIGGRLLRWWRHFGDDGREKLTVEAVQDVEPVLERNRRLYNDAPRTWGSTFNHVAEIPVTLVEEECRKLWVKSPHEKYSDIYREVLQNKTDRARKLWRKLKNDRDYRKLRTRPGRV